jgi:hypothetical protein
MKAIKIAVPFALATVTAMAFADTSAPAPAGSSWTQLTESLDCQLLAPPTTPGTSLVAGTAGAPVVSPQGQNNMGKNGTGGAQPVTQPVTQPIAQPNPAGDTAAANPANPAAPVVTSCPGGTMLFVLNSDGTYKVSDGTNGKLSDQELASVNTMLSGLSATDLAAPLSCTQGTTAVADHAVFVTLGDGSVKTISSSYASNACAVSSNSRSVDLGTVLLPIVKAHANLAPAPAPAPNPNPGA